MKKLNPLLFIPIAFIIILSSCTSEKRIYRPGYSINWKKSRSTAKESKIININAQGSDTFIAKQGEPASLPQTKVSETDFSKLNKKELTSPIGNSAFTSTGSKSDRVNNRHTSIKGFTTDHKTILDSPHKKVQPAIYAKSKGDSGSGGVVKGILMIVLGFVLLGLGYIFYTSLGVFGTILFLIFGIAAVIYFIAGTIIILRG
ncbi:MAG: hypothetical protein Q8M29_05630 [Bacteroidota bacterium]|nr:hypothetical protein [Bacteroidota bacterium]